MLRINRYIGNELPGELRSEIHDLCESDCMFFVLELTPGLVSEIASVWEDATAGVLFRMTGTPARDLEFLASVAVCDPVINTNFLVVSVDTFRVGEPDSEGTASASLVNIPLVEKFTKEVLVTAMGLAVRNLSEVISKAQGLYDEYYGSRACELKSNDYVVVSTCEELAAKLTVYAEATRFLLGQMGE